MPIEDLIEGYIEQRVNEWRDTNTNPVDLVVRTADKYTPKHIRKTYSKPRFYEYWTNVFLDHLLNAYNHPVVDAQTNNVIHPLLFDDACFLHSAEVVCGEIPEYKFPNRTQAVEYALRASVYQVFSERIENQQ